MKCCICEKINFDLIMEIHRPPHELPNLVCDLCMLTMCEDAARSISLSNLIFNMLENKKTGIGKRCK